MQDDIAMDNAGVVQDVDSSHSTHRKRIRNSSSADFIVIIRGRWQDRASVYKTRLGEQSALIMESLLTEALESGELLQGEMYCMMLMRNTKPEGVCNAIRNLQQLSAIPANGIIAASREFGPDDNIIK